MIFTYGCANDSSYEAAQLYQERFPKRQQPNPKTFAAVFRKLTENRSLVPNINGKGKQRERFGLLSEKRMLYNVLVKNLM